MAENIYNDEEPDTPAADIGKQKQFTYGKIRVQPSVKTVEPDPTFEKNMDPTGSEDIRSLSLTQCVCNVYVSILF